MLKHYYNRVICQDFLNKFFYKNCMELPFLKKIVLRFIISQSSLKNFLPAITGMLLVSNQKPFLKISKKVKIRLQLKGGVAGSCLVDLRGKEKYFFLEKLIFFIIPRLKDFKYTIHKTHINFDVDNIFLFKELEKGYEYFQHLPKLNVSLFFQSTIKSEILVFLSSIKFPSND